MWNYIHTDELYHHGIKGMKWGVRRFQNEDGSLTREGQKRYAQELEQSTRNKSRFEGVKTARNALEEGRVISKDRKSELKNACSEADKAFDKYCRSNNPKDKKDWLTKQNRYDTLVRKTTTDILGSNFGKKSYKTASINTKSAVEHIVHDLVYNPTDRMKATLRTYGAD